MLNLETAVMFIVYLIIANIDRLYNVKIEMNISRIYQKHCVGFDCFCSRLMWPIKRLPSLALLLSRGRRAGLNSEALSEVSVKAAFSSPVHLMWTAVGILLLLSNVVFACF